MSSIRDQRPPRAGDGSDGSEERGGVTLAQPPSDLLQQLETDIASAGGERLPDPAMENAIGATMFDQPGSEDNSVTVLLPREKAQRAPSPVAGADQEPTRRR